MLLEKRRENILQMIHSSISVEDFSIYLQLNSFLKRIKENKSKSSFCSKRAIRKPSGIEGNEKRNKTCDNSKNVFND